MKVLALVICLCLFTLPVDMLEAEEAPEPRVSTRAPLLEMTHRSYKLGIGPFPKNMPTSSMPDILDGYAQAGQWGEVCNHWDGLEWYEKEDYYINNATTDLTLNNLYKNNGITIVYQTNLWNVFNHPTKGMGAWLSYPPDMDPATTMGDQEFRRRWVNHVRNITSFLQPEYFCLGNEVNSFYNWHVSNEADFQDNFTTLMAESYTAIKEVSPNTTVVLTWRLVEFYAFDNWEILTWFNDTMADVFAFTSYPSLTGSYATPADLPEDYYTKICDYTGFVRLAIAELGWTSHGAYAGSEQEQYDFLEWFINNTRNMPFDYVQWFTLHDHNPEGSAVSHAQTVGLKRTTGHAKPGWALWQELYNMTYTGNLTYNVREPIEIIGDENFTVLNGISGGNGSKENPYVIEGWEIDGYGWGNCISLINTSKHVVVRDSNCYGAFGSIGGHNRNAGVYLYNATMVDVFNMTLNGSDFGVYTIGANNSFVRNSDLSSNAMGGYILSSEFVTLENSTFDQCNAGLYLSYSTDCTVRNNSISNNDEEPGTGYWGHGLIIAYSSHRATAIDNNCNYNDEEGILVYDFCSDVSLINNTANSNREDGIWLEGSNNIFLSSNTASLNGDDGISVRYGNGGSIIDSTCWDNTDDGISIEYHGSLSDLSNNSCMINGDIGIFIIDTSVQRMSQNDLSYNADKGLNCIGTGYEDVYIDNTTCNWNNDGLYLASLNEVVIQYSESSYNQNGIYGNQISSMTIHQCSLANNSNYGIRILDTLATIRHSFFNGNFGNLYLDECPYLHIYGNAFMDGGFVRHGLKHDHSFCNEELEIGNYYVSYQKWLVPYASHDHRVWDTPYEILSCLDLYPLVYPPGQDSIQLHILDTGSPQVGRNFTTSCRITNYTNEWAPSINYWFHDDSGHNYHNPIVVLNETSSNTTTFEVPIDPEDGPYLSYQYEFDIGFEIFSPVRTVMVQDDIKPQFHATIDPTYAFVNTPFQLTAHASDNLKVEDVRIEYWYGSGAHNNVSMTENGSIIDRWNINITPPNELTTFSYLYHATDREGNWIHSMVRHIPILDNVLPTFGLDSTPSVGTTGDNLTFKIEVTDNIAIGNVTVEFFSAGQPVRNETMEGSGPYTFTTTVPSSSTATIRYVIHACDTSGNWITSTWKDITISDNDPPVADASSDMTWETGVIYTFDGSSSTDNVGIASYKWSFQYYYVDVTLTGIQPTFNFEVAGEYHVTLEVKDNDGNTDMDTMIVTVTEAPNQTINVLIFPVIDINGQSLEGVNVTLEVDGKSYTGVTDMDGSVYIELPVEAKEKIVTVTLTMDGYEDLTYYPTLDSDGDLSREPPPMQEAKEGDGEAGSSFNLVWLLLIFLAIIIIGICAFLFGRDYIKTTSFYKGHDPPREDEPEDEVDPEEEKVDPIESGDSLDLSGRYPQGEEEPELTEDEEWALDEEDLEEEPEDEEPEDEDDLDEEEEE